MAVKERIVIFDMDGTLVDSSNDITASINFVRRKKGLENLEAASVVKAINSKETKLAQIFYETKEYEKKDKDMFENHYWDQCIQNISVYPEVEDVLNNLRENAYSLSIATNAPTIFAKKMMKHTKLSSYFDFIMGSCDVKNSKPDPEMINKILKRYRFDSERFAMPVVIGDSHKDLTAAKNAKIASIHVRWGFSHDSIDGVTSAKTPKELLKILESL